MSTITTVKITTDSDSAMVKAALGPLLQSSGGRWNLTLQNNGVEREFKFKTFQKTWEFMNAVAGEAASVKHHPEWSNVSPPPLPPPFAAMLTQWN
jgi:4a-hydroxytetrahydrobiopterin dehydratase